MRNTLHRGTEGASENETVSDVFARGAVVSGCQGMQRVAYALHVAEQLAEQASPILHGSAQSAARVLKRGAGLRATSRTLWRRRPPHEFLFVFFARSEIGQSQAR